MASNESVTMQDIADLLGISQATVSYYLNGKYERMSDATRRKIADAIERTGYVPNLQARNLSGKPSRLIGVLILDITNAWAGQILAGIESVAEQSGFQTIIRSTNFDPKLERESVEMMLSLGVEGLIIQPTSNFKEINKRITRANRHVVFYDCNLFDFKTSWVKTDLYDGVYNAISSCVESGYERFLTVAAEPDSARTRAERFEGFKDALAANDLAYETINVDRASLSPSNLERLFQSHIVTAHKTLVFVQNVWALPAVYKAMRSYHDLMPDPVGLLGMNCTDWTNLTTPSVSTIVEPVAGEGRQACRIILDLIHGTHEEDHHCALDCDTNWMGTTLSTTT